jgi:hypothetical protein
LNSFLGHEGATSHVFGNQRIQEKIVIGTIKMDNLVSSTNNKKDYSDLEVLAEQVFKQELSFFVKANAGFE